LSVLSPQFLVFGPGSRLLATDNWGLGTNNQQLFLNPFKQEISAIPGGMQDILNMFMIYFRTRSDRRRIRAGSEEAFR
jgi:hypothetical protein